jgi:hypothetical protein
MKCDLVLGCLLESGGDEMAGGGAHRGAQLLQNSAAGLLDKFTFKWKEVVALYNLVFWWAPLGVEEEKWVATYEI